jgi:hypothetical protein
MYIELVTATTQGNVSEINTNEIERNIHEKPFICIKKL